MRPLLNLMLVLILASPALAADGVLEINATCAVQTGCFAGDTPGYPVSVTQPGSYRLTSNLVQPDAATSVILATANDVSIDLGGFEISGPFLCPGNPANCLAAGNSYAVDANGVSGASVTNGAVRGTARGILLGDHCVVRDVRVVETTNSGIFVGAGCAISRVVVARNGNHGVSLTQGTVTVTDSAAYDNEGSGFSFGLNATITGSSARRNGGNGILGNAGTQVSNCVASDNTLDGISLNIAGTVTSSSSYSNTGSGIRASAGSVVRFNSAYGNSDRGIVLGAGSQAIGNSIRFNIGLGLTLGDLSGYRENVLTANNGGAEIQVGAALVSDTIFNLGSNVCGTDTACP